jgi:signal transduction histidine kinase
MKMETFDLGSRQQQLERVRPKWFGAAVFINLLMFGLIGWQALNTYCASRDLQQAFVHGDQLRDRLVALQQEQMLSLAMLVATGSSGWREQYTQLERDLDTTIRLAIREAIPGYDQRTLHLLQRAHARLRDRAARTVELARTGHVREGLGMLTSQKFQVARKEFNHEVSMFISDYRKFLEKRLIEGRNGALLSLGVGFLIFLVSVTVWIFLLRNLERQRRALKGEVGERKAAEEGLRQLAGHLQSVGEQERTTIARELHDETGQSLAAVKIDLVRLGKRLAADDDKSRVLLDRSQQLVTETIDAVQRIFSGLRPSILDHLGLVATVEWQANEFQEHTGIECNLSLPPNDPNLSRDDKTAIFRIVQEGLVNASRHSDATAVLIDLHRAASSSSAHRQRPIPAIPPAGHGWGSDPPP